MNFDELKEKLPHGSGIDCDWKLENETEDQTIVSNYWHAMDTNGYYCGYVYFEVKLDKQGNLLDVEVDQESIDAILKDYEPEDQESESDEYTESFAPYLDDLDDYLYETINYCLTS